MARKKTPQRDAIDFGTPEMARRFTIVPRLSSPTTMTGKVIDGDEIDRMLLRDEIKPAQHGTLTMLAKRLHSYGYVALKSPDYSSRIHADAEAVADKKSEIIRGAVNLIKKMDDHPAIGKYRRMKLISLVLEDAKWGDKRNQLEDLWHCIRALDDIMMKRG